METEISNIDDIAGESSRLYQTLQQSVDKEIQHTGFIPEHGYGMDGKSNGNGHAANGNGHSNGHINGNGHNGDVWACSDKQRELIVKLVEEHNLDRKDLDDTSLQMFGASVRELNRLQASGLIDRLLDEHGGGSRTTRRPSNGTTPPRRQYANGGAR